MSLLVSVIHDLRGRPLPKRVEVTRYAHCLSQTAERERAEGRKEAPGYLDEKEGLPSQGATAPRRSAPLARSSEGNCP